MLDAIVSWPTFIAALIVFGFAPGAFLRLIVLAFERDDPRRVELLAEVHVVPRIERPFWVFEQLEVALFEGLLERIRWAATGRVIHRWRLVSGVESHRAHPKTFWIPDESERRAVEAGVVVKLLFRMRDGWGERMWVEVEEVTPRRVVGKLMNTPVGIPRLWHGDRIKFTTDHIIDIDWEPTYLDTEGSAESPAPAT